MAFFENPRFPREISYNSVVDTEYKTDIVDMSGGSESRLIRWADARRSYNAAFGVRTMPQLESLLDFFHSCKGKAHGFRFQDPLEYKSCPHLDIVSATDQILVPIIGSTTQYQLWKRYNSGTSIYRDITKPVVGKTVVALGGTPVTTGWTINTTTGVITFSSTPIGVVTAGFEFDVPCRFDTDKLSADLISYQLISTAVPIIEIKP